MGLICSLYPDDDMPKTVRYAILSFFLLNTANFLLRPIRDSIGIRLGESLLPYLFMGTLVLMVLISVWFGRALNQVARRRWHKLFYGIFCAWLLVYFLGKLSFEASLLMNGLFFVSISVFNLFSISLLWSILVSEFKQENAGKLFGKIATGLAMGAIAGSVFGSLLVSRIGQNGLVLLAIPLILLSLFFQQTRLNRKRPTEVSDLEEKWLRKKPSWWNILLNIKRSPVLRASSAQIFLYAMINTFFYFEQLALVASSSMQPVEQVRLLANIALIIHVLSFLLQWFGFQYLVRRFSHRQLFVIIPVLVSLLLVWQFLQPAFWLLILGMTCHKIGSYALVRPLREVLHTRLADSAKFGAKNLVDTVFARSGDVAGSWTYEWLFNSLVHPFWVGILGLPVGVAWIWNSWYLARITENKS